MVELFTSFEGRISRKSFWLGILGIIVISFALIIIVGFLFFGSGLLGRLVAFLLTLALFYPMAAISVKRLHDRDKPAMPLIAIFFVPGILSNLMSTFGIGFTTMEFAGQLITAPNTLGYVVMMISMITGIWALVELGFLRGTPGENRFGPDPLGQTTASAGS